MLIVRWMEAIAFCWKRRNCGFACRWGREAHTVGPVTGAPLCSVELCSVCPYLNAAQFFSPETWASCKRMVVPEDQKLKSINFSYINILGGLIRCNFHKLEAHYCLRNLQQSTCWYSFKYSAILASVPRSTSFSSRLVIASPPRASEKELTIKIDDSIVREVLGENIL